MHEERFGQWYEREVNRAGVNWFGQYIRVGGDLIHYVEAGSGEPVIMVHGLLAWSFSWRKNLPYISGYGHVYAPDLPGFGLSGKNRTSYSLEDQTETLLRFMDALSIHRAVICGHSMGGEVAMRLAMRAPDRVCALILVSSSGYLMKGKVPGEDLLMRWPWLSGLLARHLFLNRRFARRTLQTAYHKPGGVTEADVEGYLLPARAPGAPQALVSMLGSLDFGAHAGRYSSIRKPALLIWGENDPWVPVDHGKRLALELPLAELVILPECGHCPQEEYPDQFNETVVRFLKRLGEYSGPAADD